MVRLAHLAAFALVAVALAAPARAEELTAEQKAKIEQRFAAVEALAASKAVVDAVTERNAKTPTELAGMTQEKWKNASVIGREVHELGKNAVADALRDAQATDAAISEAFVSAADGTKVGFLSKPTNWSHKGLPKHDEPMAGKRWRGPVELDASSGVKQVQIAVPVLVGGKPAGSLVVGFQVLKL